MRFLPDEQLRFRLGRSMWFDTGAGGWTSRPDQGWELELDEQLMATAQGAALFSLPLEGRNDIEKRTNIALRWFEQAQLAGDPLMGVLFCFTALEAILGEVSSKLKAPDLALRRGLLGFMWDVRMALTQYLRLARKEGLLRRRQVRKLLDEHPSREKVIAGLLRSDPNTWEEFFAERTDGDS